MIIATINKQAKTHKGISNLFLHHPNAACFAIFFALPAATLFAVVIFSAIVMLFFGI